MWEIFNNEICKCPYIYIHTHTYIYIYIYTHIYYELISLNLLKTFFLFFFVARINITCDLIQLQVVINNAFTKWRNVIDMAPFYVAIIIKLQLQITWLMDTNIMIKSIIRIGIFTANFTNSKEKIKTYRSW